MKLFSWVGLGLLSLTFLVARAEDSSSLSLKWQPVPGAQSYELEFTSKSDPDKQVRKQVKKTQAKVSLLPGKYELRTRSYDKEGVPGPWSEGVEVAVKQLQNLSLSPEDGSIVNAEAQGKHSVSFKWNPMTGVKRYLLFIEGEKFKKVYKTTETTHTVDLPIARKYQWEVRAVSPKGIVYRTKDKLFHFTIEGGALNSPVIKKPPTTHVEEIVWNTVPASSHYSGKLYYKPLLGNVWTLIAEMENEPQRIWSFKEPLKPGAYRVQIIAQAERRIPSEPAQREFIVKPKIDDLL